jgi:glycosyltransferase involved in cell wall biosynthesis
MPSHRPLFTICIPAYNRTRHLPSLLDSILSQDFDDFDILICEDLSRERPQIAAVVQEYAVRHPGKIVYSENEQNLGYDRNIRHLVELARGQFCFFMGNDDLLCPGALRHVAELLGKHQRVGLVLKSYAWFDGTPDKVNQEVRYFDAETAFASGAESIGVCFRRSGVISGYIINRDAAHAYATDRFDGSLYYQMHLTASVLADHCAVATPMVLVLCRNGEPPEFGNSASEKGKYVPGRYTPQARLNMIGGAMSIVKYLRDNRGVDVVAVVERDYANYFYPYIKDQLDLPLTEYWAMYRSFGRMGFYRYPLFHVYFLVGYILGEKRFDDMTRRLRGLLGRSPQFGLRRR